MMAIPYFDAKALSRSNGHSSVGGSAYRSGTKLKDERTGKIHDYTRRDGVAHTEILAPDGAPEWVYERESLWNKVEWTEKRKDSQVAREILAALPRELDLEQNKALVREYVQENFVKRGMVADIAIHNDAENHNPHVHILLTMRELDGDGFASKKNRDWNKKAVLQEWRDSWEECQNRHLEEAGREERISMQSYKDQGMEKESQVHLGKHATALEKQGVETVVGNHNRQVRHDNAVADHGRPLGQGLDVAANENAQEWDMRTWDRQPEMQADASLERHQERVRAFAASLDTSPVDKQVIFFTGRQAESPEPQSQRDAFIQNVTRIRPNQDIDREILDEYAPSGGKIDEPTRNR